MPIGAPRRKLRERHPQRVTHRSAERRPTSSQRGYGYRWQQYVVSYIRQNPLCRLHEARCETAPTECVDHIVPVSGPDDPLFWEPSNHQPLCIPCHSVKTNTVDRGQGRSRSPSSSPF